jgi:hypothetical protein
MKSILQIGRAPDNDIVLNDGSVSKHHAQLVINSSDDVGIVDLNSTNGTSVNGAKIVGYQKLGENDIVKIGTQLLTWRNYVREFAPLKRENLPESHPPLPAAVAAPQVSAAIPQQYAQRDRPTPPKKKSGSNMALGCLIGLILLGVSVAVLMNVTGASLEGMINIPNTIDLNLECSQVNYLVLASEVSLVVENLSDRTHDNVSVRITGFDKFGKQIIEKIVSYELAIGPRERIPKMVGLPAKVRSCKCELLSSRPR